jgi:ABC-2 type transport system permease protein
VRQKLEEILSQSLGQPVSIVIQGNFVYPSSDGVLLRSISTINSVLMILMMGIFLVPSLLIEEKETKTIQALLVSPASISQVVVGKALAGLFYILVTAVLIFIISWAEVIHWDMVILFVIGSGLFSVAVGLVLGSFYEKQQDMVGWMTFLLLFLVGAILVKMLGVELPALVESLLPWVPSVALAEICRSASSEFISPSQVWTNTGIILSVSLLLYSLVTWKVRRSDR